MSDEKALKLIFWRNIIRAVEANPIEVNNIQGVSGLNHSIIIAGVDPVRRRLIIISPEQHAPAAALIQADLQAIFKAIQVVMVRCDLPASREQPSLIFPSIEERKKRDNLMASDSQLGLCAIRIDEFNSTELDSLQKDDNLRAIRDILRNHHLLQYFFPAPDHLALGLIERLTFTAITQVVDQLVRVPDLGHPFGPTELMPPQYSFTEMIQELQKRKLVVAGEDGLKITEEGNLLRATVRDKPREGMVFKILNRLSAAINFKSSWLPILRHGQE
jgi:hypothetical protein